MLTRSWFSLLNFKSGLPQLFCEWELTFYNSISFVECLTDTPILFIAGSSKYWAKPLSILLTKLLKQGLQKYCKTAYSRSGVNQMWILKNSKELLEHHQSPTFNHITSIKSFDFSTRYKTIPHQKLKSRLPTITQNSFIHKKWKSQINCFGFRSRRTLFYQGALRFEKQYTGDDIINLR